MEPMIKKTLKKIAFVAIPLTKSFLSANNLMDIEVAIPGICLDLKYATDDNFVGKAVYDFKTCLLNKDAALKLILVQEELKEIGLELKVWDGFRPMAAQEQFWKILPDPRYVSDPKEGGRHTRGTAVDLTIISIDTKEELAMPTEFDNFTEKAHRDYMGASKEELANRELLQNIMEKHGFVGLSTEWWHFDLVGWENHPPIH